ncbi:MAG: hypothetical protein QOH56_367 [Pseudonocardiales bacterium]|jgi:hypothetical protein|nr:hypothetical protein [Pseudonocardiales bacterium]
MGRSKSLTLPMSIDVALRRHTCQHSKKHLIAKGDRRLKIAVARSHEHYCVACARKFIGESIDHLQQLEAQLDSPS